MTFEPIGTVLPVTTFAAVCEACDWVSAPSPSNLTALNAYDRHVASARHVVRDLELTRLATCPECGEALTVEGDGDGAGDPVHVFCDICGKAEHPADLTPDWNGETGCHRVCEATLAPTDDAYWRRYRNGEGE